MISPRQDAPAFVRGLDALRVVTWSHRSAGFDELARVALPAPAQRALIDRLRAEGLQAVLLCTCNRTELYWRSAGSEEDRAALGALAGNLPESADRDEVRLSLRGAEAARHLFRVAAGLESLLVGESEVLGQLRDALDGAERADLAGPFLASIFQAALRFGGRVRAETRIGQGALSVASAAVRHLVADHPDLTACTAVVVGAGVTGSKVARHLEAERVGRLVILNRTRARAEEEASATGAIAGALEDFGQWLAEADAVVAAVHVERPLLDASTLRAPLARRPRAVRRAPLALVDLSLPRAFDPDCATVEGVVLHDLSGLERIVAGNRALRESEIPRVESLLDRELELLEVQARSSVARPLVAELRRRAEAMRRLEIGRLAANGAADSEAIGRLNRRIVDRILQAPSEALRRGDVGLEEAAALCLREIRSLARGAEAGVHEEA